MPANSIRVLIADDHPVVLAGMKALLAADPGLEIVAEATDGSEALRLATELRPKVAVLDLSMPGLNGVEVARHMRDDCPACRVLALTVHEDGVYLRQLLDVGGAGYVLKRSATEDLIRAVYAVADGGIYLDPAIAARAVGQASAPLEHQASDSAAPGSNDLSERELGVLRLTAAGHSNKTIAAMLHIGVKTVETYKARAMGKLGFRSRVEVVRYAMGKGWLDAA